MLARKLEDNLEQHFYKRQEVFGIFLTHDHDFVIGLVTFGSNVVNQTLCIWRNIVLVRKILYIFDEFLTCFRSFGNSDVHQEFSATENSGSVSSRAGTVPCFVIEIT